MLSIPVYNLGENLYDKEYKIPQGRAGVVISARVLWGLLGVAEG